ncbi:MAG TPA: hypothetical protein VNH19_24545 [Candidatus Limnocylindrales bacterium]|nr:hypothetical protein [Candidatus Limnocylindrales bacterium]
MDEEASASDKASVEASSQASQKAEEKSSTRIDLLKAVAMPLVTLILGFWFNASLNTRQARENNYRMYAEMMGRREEADSLLRKDMFNSILGTFMSKDQKLNLDQQLDLNVLNLELLASNFHESLDIAPLFRAVRRRIPDQQQGTYASLRERLEKVSQQVIERQLTVVSDSGMVEIGDTASLGVVDDLKAYLYFGSHSIPDAAFQPGQGVSRLCLSMSSNDRERHYRQFKLELTKYDPIAREIQVRLYVSKVLTVEQCQQADLDLVGYREIDTEFWVGLFDFPMIDNTRLSHNERCAVSMTSLEPPDSLRLALAYFPGSRASLKDKPYYDELLHDLLPDKHPALENQEQP